MTVPPPETIEAASDLARLDQAIEALPNRPAVFLLWPRAGEPYLGKTGLLRRRLLRLLRQREQPSRLLNLRDVAARIEYWLTGSRLESSLLSWELARQHFPERCWKLLNLRHPPYLKVILSNQFPRTQITTRLGGRSLYYGPFRSRAEAENFETSVLDLFQMRRCQEDLAPSPAHPGCIYGEMNMCVRPCQQVVGVAEYQTEVDRVVEFLATGGRSLLESVSAAREHSSEAMDFEEAARQHKRHERIEQVLKLRDDLVADAGGLCGVAVTRAAEEGAVALWFVIDGAWQAPVYFPLGTVDGVMVSMDARLREVVATLAGQGLAKAEREAHLALLARWYYSKWRDGEWLSFKDRSDVPYRRLVRAIARVAAA